MFTSVYGALDPNAVLAASATNPTYLDPGVVTKDTTFTKIFVGGLPYHTSDKTLREFFEPYGEIEEAVVITDRQTGKSKGYGFVTMKDRAGAERACKDPNPIIDGRKANVNLAYLGAKPRANLQLISGIQPLALQTGIPLLPAVNKIGTQVPQVLYPANNSGQLLTTSGLVIPQMSPLSPSASGTQLLDYNALATAAAGYNPYLSAADIQAVVSAAAYNPGAYAGSNVPTTAVAYPSGSNNYAQVVAQAAQAGALAPTTYQAGPQPSSEAPR